MPFTLKRGDNDVVTVETEERRDVFLERGYTEVAEEKPRKGGPREEK